MRRELDMQGASSGMIHNSALKVINWKIKLRQALIDE
jgi:hypothetical protein